MAETFNHGAGVRRVWGVVGEDSRPPKPGTKPPLLLKCALLITYGFSLYDCYIFTALTQVWLPWWTSVHWDSFRDDSAYRNQDSSQTVHVAPKKQLNVPKVVISDHRKQKL